jgi:hypothetical protein
VEAYPKLDRPPIQNYSCFFYPTGLAPESNVPAEKDFKVVFGKINIKWAIRILIIMYCGFTFFTVSMGVGTGTALITKGAYSKAANLVAETAESDTAKKAADLVYGDIDPDTLIIAGGIYIIAQCICVLIPLVGIY